MMQRELREACMKDEEFRLSVNDWWYHLNLRGMER